MMSARPPLARLAAARGELTGHITPRWQDHAACARVGGELWFPDPADDPGPALGICASCPVRAACLAHALATPELYGIWGGVTETSRHRLRADLARGASVEAALRQGEPRVWRESA
jgi:WhiB family redox-sensing transcriptional regulator